VDEGKDGDSDSEVHVRVNPMQLLNVIHADKAVTSQRTGLMYVKVLLCETEVLAMVDTGATHNFVSERVVQSLGLKVVESFSRIKTVNSNAEVGHGMTGNVALRIGDWNGQVDLMVYPLDDFELILGNEFFVAAKVAVMPHLGGILIADEKRPCFVPRCSKAEKGKRAREGTGGWLSAIQAQNFPDLVVPGRKQAQRASLAVQMHGILDDKAKGQSGANGRTSCLANCENRQDSEATWETDGVLWQSEKQVLEYLQALPTRTSASSGGGGLLAP
jgi:hypothetical protein